MLQQTDYRKILLVEDDKVTQQIHIYFLKKLGFEVDLVSTGDEALISTDKTNYFAVILDLGLPGMMDGAQVLSTIREREANTNRQRLPVIIVTAHGDSTMLTRCKTEKKADDAFTKPVTFLDFKKALQKLELPSDVT
jgi:DNA-binding response OmpR family regulator